MKSNLSVRSFVATHVLHSKNFREKVMHLVVYMLLIALSIVFLAPFFYMIGHSLMSAEDWLNINIKWIPKTLVTENYAYAYKILNYLPTLAMSLGITLVAMIGQVFSCAFVGYGLARIRFKGNLQIFLLIIFTLIIPPQTIIVPQFLIFAKLGMIDTYYPIVLPCFFAMGLNGGLFVFIFRQFFKGMPEELENAALIDGTGVFGAYFKIMLPNASSAVLVTSILSLVWQWNNSFEPSVYIREYTHATLTLQLNYFQQLAEQVNITSYSRGVVMASTVLIMLPILVIFFFMQKKFMQSIETSGLAN